MGGNMGLMMSESYKPLLRFDRGIVKKPFFFR